MSTLDYRNIPQERLATTDEEGNRLHVIPAIARGVWATRKNWVHGGLLFLLLILPWINISGKPAVLLNIPDREFTFFGLSLYAHDGPLIFFLLAIAALSLVLVTIIWGRVWCGWACPQTVFIEGVFRRIERTLIGDRPQQITFNNSPLNLNKILKLSTKWILFIAASIVISHTLVAYFVGKDNLFRMMSAPPSESWTVFVIMMFVTAVILFDFVWFREQFCIIMCPYGRLQGLFLDKNSITIAYDEKRGEPRGKISEKKSGDCVDCFRCVAVCPTGIDIRKGQQLECIGCTACIDACNDVMTKMKKPINLISYRSLKDLEGFKTRFWRPRPIVFATVLLALIITFTLILFQRDEVNIAVLRAIDSPYSEILENETAYISNHFKLNIKNQSSKTLLLEVKLSPSDVEKGFQIAPQNLKLPLLSQQNLEFPLFIKKQKSQLNDGQKSKELTIEIKNASTIEYHKVVFIYP